MSKKSRAAPRKFKKRGGSGGGVVRKLGSDAPKHGFTGVVRAVKRDSNSIWFARPGSTHWAKLSGKHIKLMHPIHRVRSGRETHHLVHLVMKEPTSPDGKQFAALAAALHGPPSAPMGPPNTTGWCWDPVRGWIRCPG